tara:strand:- start:859 stop:981 length:123 start_codon:yes stop_codon:yes gene_type:complete
MANELLGFNRNIEIVNKKAVGKHRSFIRRKINFFNSIIIS